MPEGGDVAALADALDRWTRGRALRMDVGGVTVEGAAERADSLGKQFRVWLVGGPVFVGHLGLSGSAWVSTRATGETEGPWTELLSHRGPKGAMSATIEWTEGARVRRIGFRSGTGASYRLLDGSASAEKDEALDLVRSDFEVLERRWNQLGARFPKRSLEAVLTDQTELAGAGKRLRAAAFERCGVSGKEKLGAVTLDQRTRVLKELVDAARREWAQRRELLNAAESVLFSGASDPTS